ncbi:MAG: hypothetical protein HN350_16245 [Phycisphaerales bacterium]|nr:hypothetical protein [Phycisphaerales bacterium]
MTSHRNSGVLIASLVLLISSLSPGADLATVSVLSDSKVAPPVRHGLSKLTAALRAKGIVLEQAATGDILIVAAVAGKTGPAAEMHKTLSAKMPSGTETMRIKKTLWKGREILLVSGGDDRGLMYALLDVADRIGWAKDAKRPLSEVRDADEAPAVAERAMSKYTMHRSCFESYFHDEAYWKRYLDMLAQNRFNTLALLFGYENAGYFAPPYPYFFNVEGYDDVNVVGLTPAQQKRNLESLNKLIVMAHDRGLNVTLGIWDHIYRGGVQGPTADATKPTKGLVWGVTAKNLVPYTKAALTQFLKKVHNIDAIQFRMHGESGLSRKEMAEFWPDIYKIMLRHGPGIRFDARAKNFPHDLIDKAVAAGVPIRMCTKYWMEQMGLPFHPTHVNPRNQHDRRHGYADMLRYPRQYKMHWRMWNGGTTRVLLWGDPQYVRRFAESTHLYDGDGFEINEPMATKMQDHPHDKTPFDLLTKNYRYYDWEFERYWHFYQVFGRVGYNPKTPPEVWSHEFERRFGKTAGPLVQKALHRASGILPRIVACSFPYNHFPTTRGWAEMQRQGDIDAYSRSLPSDTQQFLSMTQAAKNRVTGGESAKIHPERSSRWFAKAAKDVLDLATQAEKNLSGHESKEFTSTIADLRILAGLAQYHSHRLLSGVSWAVFKQTQNPAALDDAIAHETNAAKAWGNIVAAAGDIYHNDLMMGRRGSGLSGHWKDELAKIEKGLAAMIQQRKTFKSPPADIKPIPPLTVTDDTTAPTVTHKPIATAPAEKPLTITADVRDAAGVKWVRLRYRSVTQFEDYRTLEMKPTGQKDQYRCVVPGEHIPAKWDFMYLLEVMDKNGNGTIWPDLNERTPYIIIRLKR